MSNWLREITEDRKNAEWIHRVMESNPVYYQSISSKKQAISPLPIPVSTLNSSAFFDGSMVSVFLLLCFTSV